MISFTFHALIVVVGLYFAARGGLLGKQIQKISVEMIKEKPPEKPKVAEKPKVEPPKEAPKIAAAPKVEPPKEAPPSATAPPTVAPPAAELPSFDFEGGKTVESSSDPVQLYKGLLEYAFRSKWNRPENLHDDDLCGGGGRDGGSGGRNHRCGVAQRFGQPGLGRFGAPGASRP